MRKQILLPLCIVCFIFIFAACGNAKSNISAAVSSETTSELTPLGQSKQQPAVTSYPDIPYTPAEDGMGIIFKYKLKDSYASREEGEADMENIEAVFHNFEQQYIDVLPREEMDQAYRDVYDIEGTLNEYLDEHFPLSEEEIKHRQDLKTEATVYDWLGMAKSDLVIFQSSPYYEDKERVYNQYQLVIADYEAGKITVDEAYEIMLRLVNPDDPYEYHPKP